MALDAGWDEEMLKVEIEALQADDFDLGLTGFDEKELLRSLMMTPTPKTMISMLMVNWKTLHNKKRATSGCSEITDLSAAIAPSWKPTKFS